MHAHLELWYQVKEQSMQNRAQEQMGKPLQYGEYLDPLLLTEEQRKRLQ